MIFNHFTHCVPDATEFGEITQNVTVKVTDFWYQSKARIYDVLLLINTIAYLISCTVSERYSLRYIQNRYIWLPLLCLNAPTEGFPWDDFRQIFRNA